MHASMAMIGSETRLCNEVFHADRTREPASTMTSRCFAGSRTALPLALVIAMTVGLGCSADTRAGWTVLAANLNSVVDYVVRIQTADGAYDRLVPKSAFDLFVAVEDVRPADASLLVLDPVTCRTVSTTALTQDHLGVEVDFMGNTWTGGDDPYGWADPWDEAGWARPTDLCEGVVPPLPLALPDPLPGEPVGDGAMGCVEGFFPFANEVPIGDPHVLSIRVETIIGTVPGCETYIPEDDLGLVPGEVKLWNPDETGGSLGVAWLGAACATGATISLFPTSAGYQVVVTSISDSCIGHESQERLAPYASTLFLPYPIYWRQASETKLEHVEHP